MSHRHPSVRLHPHLDVYAWMCVLDTETKTDSRDLVSRDKSFDEKRRIIEKFKEKKRGQPKADPSARRECPK